MEKGKVIRMRSEESGDAFSAGLNCAQAVFIPFAKEHGLSDGDGARIASSFGAGMGRMQETCGAVTGAFMAIGLKYGFTKGDDQGQKDIVLQRTKEFAARFKDKFGTLLCKELLSCDLNTDEGQRLHKAQNQRELICMNCVKYSSSVVESMACSR
jgi:C_GCAxxG_C_C family probable redox protein